MSLNTVDDDDEAYKTDLDGASEKYQTKLGDLGQLMIDLLPNQPQQQGANAGGNRAGHVRPVQDLKPAFNLNFDNSPTELAAWLVQFKSYFEASRLHELPLDQQQAFLRQGLDCNVWTAIKQKFNLTTVIFKDPLHPDEDSCEKFIEDAFYVRYPLIMRRYRFFSYERMGNQTFTDYYAKLQELAAAAQLEQMQINDYLIFRVICGMHCPKTVDKLLSIPQTDFNLNEINRVAVSVEAAKNYSGISTKSFANKVINSSKHGKKSNQGYKATGIKGKINALKEQGKCIRCGQKDHEDCPHKNTTCHKCGVKGHISTVCANPNSNKYSGNKSKARQVNSTNYTFARTTYSAKPTPRQLVSFQDSNHEFSHLVIPDSGSSRTIFSKSLLDKNGISYEPNYENEELFNASNLPMTVNGTVKLTATFKGRSRLIEGLVSEDLKEDILLSWFDAEDLGSITISRYSSMGDPSKRIEKIKKKYEKILTDSLPEKPMKGPPMKVHFKKEALAKGIIPKKIYTATQTPLHLKAAADRALAFALKNKIIEEIPINEPSEWCSRGFFVPKPDGEARLVVDLSPLNEVIERPIHPFISGAELLKNLDPESKVYCKLDAKLGYNQIPLDEVSKCLFTFLLASGRYRFLRAPMGCSASSDEWCRRSDEALAGLTGVHKLVDDILIEGKDYDTLFERIEAVLQRCLNSNIAISLKKMEVGESVTFAGYKVSSTGIHPTKEMTQAIRDYPTPENPKKVNGFLGLAKQLASFVPDLTQASAPLRELLKKNVSWQWLPDQENSFKKVKEILLSDLVLRPFNPKHKTELVTDASRQGLGFVLRQQDPTTGHYHLVQCGSRSLSSPESRYAVCELEGLAIVYAVNKCRHYLLGMENFRVVTDHKPLKGVFSKALPDVENARLRRYRERLTEFTFDIEWREGKSNEIADALSRAPVFPPNETGSADFVDVCYAINQLKKAPFDPILGPFITAAKEDKDYQLIIKAITEVKYPKSLPPAHPACQLKSVWDQLSIDPSGLIVVDGKKIYVPARERKPLLDSLHTAHCGSNKTTWRAKELYYWRGMSKDIVLKVQSCDICRPFLPSQGQEPIISGTTATGPMTDVGSDLFQIGKNYYLVMVDRYSGFPFVERLTNLSTTAILKVLEDWFNTFGWPERIRTDNGPQYRSEFDEFCEDHNIIHENSSPHYPQSNGISEAAIKQMKFLLQKVKENKKTLL